jgi:hypothetical protein
LTFFLRGGAQRADGKILELRDTLNGIGRIQ